jgi:cytochrome c oxidase subunit III
MTAETFPREPFETLARQHQAASLGIWIFLASEILLFSGLFAGYAVYRGLYATGFFVAGRQTDIVLGTINTAIMMTSSLAIAVAGRAVRDRIYRLAYRLLVATFLMGAMFLVLKGFEYREDIGKHLVPGPGISLSEAGRNCSFRITG